MDQYDRFRNSDDHIVTTFIEIEYEMMKMILYEKLKQQNETVVIKKTNSFIEQIYAIKKHLSAC